ncbi:hypothetical protein [Streptomyces sp. NPDC004680]|uniref:hypothetical protein n=1 Tax=Streptomyces sp. NPDC004680 TaxID=3154287 RepID=UPI0033B36F7D
MELDDDDWSELAREILDALNIVATVIRQDGRWARLHNDAYFARSACADFAYYQGLDGFIGAVGPTPSGPTWTHSHVRFRSELAPLEEASAAGRRGRSGPEPGLSGLGGSNSGRRSGAQFAARKPPRRAG